jgi:selenium metabolism protein YedF
MRIVDTKGQLCPAPLIAAKKALRETAAGESFILLTDNQISFDNLSRFLKDNNSDFQVSKDGDVWTLTITGRAGSMSEVRAEDYCAPSIAHFEKGNYIVVVSSDKMGEGDEELGHLLMGNFIKALKDLERLPLKIVFYNKGVMVATSNSSVIDHLKDLEKMGVELLLCATCVNHYSLAESIGAGTLSNIYTIAEVMTSGVNIIKP